MACQAVTDGDVFDKFRFVNEIGTQIHSQVREEVRTHTVQDTSAIIHGGSIRMSWFEIVTDNARVRGCAPKSLRPQLI
jgi:hypothetical protein